MNKSGKQISKTRLAFFIIFSILILACAVFSLILPELAINTSAWAWLSESLIKMVAIGLVFLMSLCLLKINKKSIFLTISLIAYCVAAYFLFSLSDAENLDQITLAQDIMLYSMLAHQLVLAVYSVVISKGAGLKVLNIAVRVGLSLIAYFVLTEYLPEYFDLRNSLFIIYLINSLVTLISFSCCFKKYFLMIFGVLLSIVGAVFYAFSFGWLTLFNITGNFAEFVTSFDFGFLLSIIGIYLIGCEAVFSGIYKNSHLTTL